MNKYDYTNLFVINLLNIVDYYITVIGFNLGLKELNPLFTDIISFWCIKFTISLVLTTCLLVDEKIKLNKIVSFIVLLVSCIMVGLTFYNLATLTSY